MTSKHKGLMNRALVGLAVLGLVLTGCSQTPEEEAPGQEVVDTDGSASGGISEESLASLQAMIDERSDQPTELPITVPVGVDVPTDRKITYISCGPTPECAQHVEYAQMAADALGWELKAIPSDGSPEAVRAAFEDVVRDQPDGVFFMAIDYANYSSFMPQLEENGTFLSACCTTDDPASGMDYFTGTPEQYIVSTGETMAAWVLTQQQKPTDVLYVDISAFSVLGPLKETFEATFAEHCEDCTVDSIDIPFSSIGVDVPTRVVSALRANPDIEYIAVATDSLALGLPAALETAGFGDVKIVGESPVPANLDMLRAGEQEATVLFADAEIIWLMIDAIVRNVAGVEQQPSAYPDTWIVTGETAPQEKGPVVKDSFEQFKALWGVQ